MIYLDHAATTPLGPEAAEAMARAQTEAFANPSSPHAAGRRAKQSLEDSRDRILELLGATASGRHRDRFVFTSGATEANRLGILGLAAAAAMHWPLDRCPGTILISPRDHSSILAAAEAAGHRGFGIRSLPLSSAGTPDRAALGERNADGSCTIVTATIACGQTGIVDDPRLWATEYPAVIVHADATQSAAWLDMPFRDLHVSAMAVAPHKFGGPRGIGGLVVAHGRAIEPVAAGPQESGLRGGTEPVVLAAGFAAALAAAVGRRQAAAAILAGLREDFERRIVAASRECGVAAVPIGGDCRRSPHISTISFPGLDRQAIVMAADLAGVACSTGTACSSGSAEPAPAITAMSPSPEIVRGAVRFSFAATSTPQEIDQSVELLTAVLRCVAHGLARKSAGGEVTSS